MVHTILYEDSSKCLRETSRMIETHTEFASDSTFTLSNVHPSRRRDRETPFEKDILVDERRNWVVHTYVLRESIGFYKSIRRTGSKVMPVLARATKPG